MFRFFRNTVLIVLSTPLAQTPPCGVSGPSPVSSPQTVTFVYQPGPEESKDTWTMLHSYGLAKDGFLDGPASGLLVVGGRIEFDQFEEFYQSLIEFKLDHLPAAAVEAYIELFCPDLDDMESIEITVDRVVAFWDWHFVNFPEGKDFILVEAPTAVPWLVTFLPAPQVNQ